MIHFEQSMVYTVCWFHAVYDSQVIDLKLSFECLLRIDSNFYGDVAGNQTQQWILYFALF